MLERIDCLRKTIERLYLFIIMKNFQTACNFLSDSLKFSLFPTQCPNKDNPSNSGVKS